MTTTSRLARFPDGFVWGASTAAFQIEGAGHLEGRRDSIWDAFCRVPGAVLDDHDGEVACDHYFRYAEDVGIMRELNLDAYRFSASWARVRPDGGPVNGKGLDFYSRLVDELLGAGIQPWLTLYHWDLPQALEDRGGWAQRDTAYRFVDYTLSLHEAIGDRVAVWTTLNEPMCAAYLGYGNGQHAPGRTDRRASLAAVHHLLLAHGMAAAELTSRRPGTSVSISLNLTLADPADPDSSDDVEATRRLDGQWNRIFLDPLFHGRYPEDVLADTAHLGLVDHVHDHDLEVIATPLDVLGVNYYHGDAVSSRRPSGRSHADPALPRPVADPLPAADGVHRVPRGLPTTTMGWEIQPEGLARLLLRVHEEYTGPAGVGLAVTETGAAYADVVGPDGTVDDPPRREFIELHIRAVADAVARGADVRAFFVWSLLDNFEWAWGYSRRFGLVHVDFATQRRTVKTSGRWYAELAAGRPLTQDEEQDR
jgi:beta-glucosidase